jgi:hypothetical protein
METPKSGGFGSALLKLLAFLLVCAGGWTWFSLSWAYSDGDRGGVLQKFSRKGWICKTWEGELALYVVPGLAPQIWYFTVRDEATAREAGRLVGERVQAHYSEHRGVPTSCFGDTGYFVDHVNRAPDPPGTPAAAPVMAPAIAPTVAPASDPASAPAIAPASAPSSAPPAEPGQR